ncbi:MAG: DegV family protein [Polyangiaceae bacterium]
MRIVTNPGSNLSLAEISRYGVTITPQHLVVDGVQHDTRKRIPHFLVDDWVAHSAAFPHMVGTTASEFAHSFATLARSDREILSITTSRRVIQTYAASIIAAKTLRQSAEWESMKIVTFDSGFTDLAAGLLVVAAAELSRRGMALEDVVKALETLSSVGRMAIVPDRLDNLVKGGRASAFRGFLANMFEVKPLLGVRDGELRLLRSIRRGEDRLELMVDELAMVGAGRRVWVAVGHGNDPSRGDQLMKRLEARFDVAYSVVRPLCAATYLHAGAGAVFACVLPIDSHPFALPTPAKADEPSVSMAS